MQINALHFHFAALFSPTLWRNVLNPLDAPSWRSGSDLLFDSVLRCLKPTVFQFSLKVKTAEQLSPRAWLSGSHALVESGSRHRFPRSAVRVDRDGSGAPAVPAAAHLLTGKPVKHVDSSQEVVFARGSEGERKRLGRGWWCQLEPNPGLDWTRTKPKPLSVAGCPSSSSVFLSSYRLPALCNLTLNKNWC